MGRPRSKEGRYEHLPSSGGGRHVLDYGDQFGPFIVTAYDPDCVGCRDEVITDRARSTLTLLSRVAVFMWMEASQVETRRLYPEFRETEVQARRYMFMCAIRNGMFKLDWGRP